MDLVVAARLYVEKMISFAGPGMKLLLMDSETTSIISAVYAQSEIMQKEVYLCDRIDRGSVRDVIRHLKCLVFVRPTAENVDRLAEELRMPKYGLYYLYFSNVISKADVKLLAEADVQEVVREVQEFFADYICLGAHLFNLNIAHSYQRLQFSPDTLKRCSQCVTSVLLSLRKNPMIRYQNSSDMAKKLAESIKQTLVKESALFEFRRTDVPTVLMILDRRDDAVTPLLNQWTYQAMVHELLNINNNRVDLSQVPNVTKDMKEIVLSSLQDEFYAKNMYADFGEIGQRIKELMSEFQQKAKTNQKLDSINDMKSFIETYPQFKKMSGTVAKHVTLVGELSRLVHLYNLLEISELEQQLACHEEHSQSLQTIRKLLSHQQTSDLDATRLVMLYALHYEQHTNNDIKGLMHTLKQRGVPDKYCKAVQDILKFGGIRARSSDLFGNMSAMSVTKKFIKGLKGVENIYTQHVPYLVQVLDQLVKSKLREGSYPIVEGTGVQYTGKLSEVIVFVIGGVTYEESMACQVFMRNNPGTTVILGGTSVHNVRTFIEELVSAVPQDPERSIDRYQKT